MAQSKPGRVLLIEDHAPCREVTILLCEEIWPAAVIDEAETLAQGVACWQRCPADLILSDLRLPDSQPDVTMATLTALLPPLIPLIVIILLIGILPQGMLNLFGPTTHALVDALGGIAR